MSADLRDEVIAGLRERGWPEPQTTMGMSFWKIGESISTGVCYDRGKREIVWTTADEIENGEIDLKFNPPASRIIEAIDRLRWVIGLPSEWAYCRDEVEAGDCSAAWSAFLEHWRKLHQQHEEQTRAELYMLPFWTEGEVPECGTDPATGVFTAKKGRAALRKFADTYAGLVPLPPSKPEPKPERPYEQRKIGEF